MGGGGGGEHILAPPLKLLLSLHQYFALDLEFTA